VIELDTLRSAVPWLVVPLVPVALVTPPPTAIERRATQLASDNGDGWDAQLGCLAAAGLKPGIVAVARELLNARLHAADVPTDLAMQTEVGIYRETAKKYRELLLDLGADVFPASAVLEPYQQQARNLTARVVTAGIPLAT
jgi:hypothetical protein